MSSAARREVATDPDPQADGGDMRELVARLLFVEHDAGIACHPERHGLVRCRPIGVNPSCRSSTSTSLVSSALSSTKSKPVGGLASVRVARSRRQPSGCRTAVLSCSQSSDRRACTAVRSGSVCRKVSLKTSNESGPS